MHILKDHLCTFGLKQDKKKSVLFVHFSWIVELPNGQFICLYSSYFQLLPLCTKQFTLCAHKNDVFVHMVLSEINQFFP